MFYFNLLFANQNSNHLCVLQPKPDALDQLSDVLKGIQQALSAQTKAFDKLTGELAVGRWRSGGKTPPSAARTTRRDSDEDCANGGWNVKPTKRRLSDSNPRNLSKAEMIACAGVAAQLFYSDGGWNVRWAVDKVSFRNQAVDKALKHIMRDELASTREVDLEQHDKLFKAVDNKINNLFNVVNWVLLCFILFYFV